MKFKLLTSVLSILIIQYSFAQNNISFIVKDAATNQNIYGVNASIKSINKSINNNKDSLVSFNNLPNGIYYIEFSFVNYQTKTIKVTLPTAEAFPAWVLLDPKPQDLSEVIVQGTRSNRSIANTPTRVEVLTEEIDEASTMDPSKVAHLLTHSTGIQVQQTSATSNTANVRIQGLDGRYTQILKDGFPLYGGFSGSLSIMQIPPLDLRQVEYIKGGASTLYGVGAISGLINLISKEPTHQETLLHLNASHIGAFDMNVFTSKKTDKMGFTILAQKNTHKIFDADDDGYSDMPQLTKYNFNPKLFFYINPKTKLSIGATFANELRQGGDVNLLNNEPITATNFYKEVNDISRTTTQIQFDYKLNDQQFITIKNSFNFFDRSLSITPSFNLGEYKFAGKQTSSFSEFAYTHRKGKNNFITGVNFYTDNFKETPLQSTVLRNETFTTLGAFANYTFDINKSVAIESGLRIDNVVDQKWHILPRVSALFKWTNKLTSRIGVGFGYRNASIFNQEAELLGYKNVLPINRNTTQAEQSIGGNIDIGYKTTFGDGLSIQFNQMFFYTHLNNPLTLQSPFMNVYSFENANGNTTSMGAETFFKFGFSDFMLFVGYTYTDATNNFNNTKTNLTLTPKHSLKGDLLYSIPGKWRIGMDYELKSEQLLNNGLTSPSFWSYGALVEYTYKHYTFFGNVENFTNVRQTNFGSLKSQPYNTPQFTDVWAPLDGIVFNAGFKVRM